MPRMVELFRVHGLKRRQMFLESVDIRLSKLTQIVFLLKVCKKTLRRHQHSEDVPADPDSARHVDLEPADDDGPRPPS